MMVFVFGADVPVGNYPNPREGAIPLPWIGYLSHETEHSVYTLDSRSPADEDVSPSDEDGLEHSGEPRTGLGEAPAADTPDEHSPTRSERLAAIAAAHPSVERYVVVDDTDVADAADWEYYPPSEFVSAVSRGEFGTGLPSDSDSVPDGGR